ncbi:zinc-binding dehydrogenase [Sulfitobacter brevis]|uniref:zinc-binding dehydrogenase n=1 Tax=Sulfitobacter brevis TaxID=74348 RepID=UPI001FE5D5D4|nr:zinc-binding dehydrogenase [Sulfitobacter brevis]
MPEIVSDTAGAQLIAMPFSALSLLETLKAQKGDWIIQTASNGAVGKVMATLAKVRGINLLNLVRRDEAVTELTALGIDNVLPTSDADWKQKARALIGDAGAFSAIDSVGGDISASLVELLGVDRELVVFGTATGAPMPFNSGVLIMKHITVKGFWRSRVSQQMPAKQRTRLITELVTLVASGLLVLEDGGLFALEDVSSAIQAALTPAWAGKVMLRQ